jgi:proton-dependent oligopeptide transporter, POT family
VEQPKLGFVGQLRSYPSTFWVANTMEIFERMAWYGWFAVSSLYITGAVETGGLGFTSEQRGQIQAVIPFLLYLMPVFTGALADRYGYRKMFTIAYLVMILAYFLLGQFRTFPTFMTAFLFVAIGAAIFKPVIVGTVARVTDERNSAMGFGIFYMMVNIGGFVGPIVAGLVRGLSWEYVFIACSFWAFINLMIVLVFYKEPTTEAKSATRRTFKKVLENSVEVLGNVRFFVTSFTVLIALMLANQGVSWFTWKSCLYFIPIWVGLNFIYDWLFLHKTDGSSSTTARTSRRWFLKRMHCSNWRFALFLLIMSGFWTSFQQIFITMPEYIRDFTETRPLIYAVESVLGGDSREGDDTGVAAALATISESERGQIAKKIGHLLAQGAEGRWSEEHLEDASRTLLESKVRLLPSQLRTLVESGGTVEQVTDRAIALGRQVNPEFIVNLDAGAIIVFQIFISFMMGRFHRFTTIIVGMTIAGVGIGLSAFAGDSGMIGLGGSVWVVIVGIVTFAIGEMMASPTSQEYVGRIAPRDKVALYMGYYFVAIALGNLFSGILSGQLYGKLARDMQRPDLMWIIFGGIMILTALSFWLYNRFALPKSAADSLTPELQ